MAGVTAARQPRGLGLALRDPLAWEGLAGVVREGERLGYVAVFLPEISARDAFAALTGLAGETTGILLGTGVVPMRSRTPVLTAMAAATVHERSGGRLVLGIGTGPAGKGALEELERMVIDVRALLRGETVTRDGRAARLALPPGSEVPVWISAMGRRAFELGGRIADGVLLNWCTPERVTFARAAIAEGARAAGRDPAGVAVAVYVRSWVGEDRETALTVTKAAAGEYARYPAYARQFAQLGVGAEAEAAAAAVAVGRPQDVSDHLVHAFTAFDGAAPGRLAEYAAAGADLVLVYPVAVGEAAHSILGTVRALAPGSG
jgi:alkanesulfonate monooxygenase SsuD/methylene tetrahydromethanopterin reductase-like flavin-dependent oxidoreductase (luciferase family)